MKAVIKLVIGIIIALIGIALYTGFVNSLVPGLTIRWWYNFLLVASGVVPLLLIIGGAFVIWLEIDEIKTSRQFSKTTSAPKPQPQQAKPAATTTQLIQPKVEEKK
ncbi:MAG TPA: hypothetical protein VJA47_05530 [archaeon]|nr:hypothetical protein [archaeon]